MNKKPIQLMVDADTMEVTEQLFAGDKMKITRAEQNEYYANHTINFGSGRPFVKVYTDIIPYMKNELTKTEFSAVFLLLPHTSYEDCVIREDGTTKNSHMLELKEICEAIGEKYDNGRRIIRGLYSKGVLGRFSCMKAMGNKKDVVEREVYYMNPYLLFKGSDILNNVLECFEDSIWYRYYMEIENSLNQKYFEKD